MKVLYRVRPYEKEKGAANALYEKWVEICIDSLGKANRKTFVHTIRQIVEEFDALEIVDVIKPKVGLVGEILVKFHPTANNNIVNLIEEEGAEAVMPELTDFLLYCAKNQDFRYRYLSGTKKGQILGNASIELIEFYRRSYRKALEKSRRFEPPHSIHEKAEKASEVVALGNQTGEGWFLTGEMIELIESGVQNIVCMQPFACLPNHVTGKGMMKELKYRYPESNIVAIDYDPGASEVNQLNRIKLMLSVAFDNIKAQPIRDKRQEENDDAYYIDEEISI